jgi:hypothetical protein
MFLFLIFIWILILILILIRNCFGVKKMVIILVYRLVIVVVIIIIIIMVFISYIFMYLGLIMFIGNEFMINYYRFCSYSYEMMQHDCFVIIIIVINFIKIFYEIQDYHFYYDCIFNNYQFFNYHYYYLIFL